MNKSSKSHPLEQKSSQQQNSRTQHQQQSSVTSQQPDKQKYQIPMKANPDLIIQAQRDISLDKNKSTQNQQVHKSKKKKHTRKTRHLNSIEEVTDGNEESVRTVIKIIPMKNLEILFIGAPKVGKTTLINKLMEQDDNNDLKEKKEYQTKQLATIKEIADDDKSTKKAEIISKPYIYGVGMEVHKKEHIYKNGETVRLSIWDPTITQLPKERALARKNKQQAEQKQGLLKSLFSKKQDDSQSGQDVELPFIEEFQLNTNEELANDYLKSGTYHVAVFVFDLTNHLSFNMLEDWFNHFRKDCFKSSKISNIAIIGTKKDLGKRGIPTKAVEDWVVDLQDELSSSFQRLKYFEISGLKDEGIKTLRDWIIQNALEKYDSIEKRRYIKSDPYVKNRECGLDCSIF
ncbi:small gtpase [Stylonychia lemnae]|uniref:Small gtpase n=1 Tax=Stylonychia lemnae TaxID=5949 RepID=A0A078AED1_STYLE|nr:small gtpase [Stylonychia lemnae]|eukprot:CDW80619.1 small gtpase [Stylonychia lemnae]